MDAHFEPKSRTKPKPGSSATSVSPFIKGLQQNLSGLAFSGNNATETNSDSSSGPLVTNSQAGDSQIGNGFQKTSPRSGLGQRPVPPPKTIKPFLATKHSSEQDSSVSSGETSPPWMIASNKSPPPETPSKVNRPKRMGDSFETVGATADDDNGKMSGYPKSKPDLPNKTNRPQLTRQADTERDSTGMPKREESPQGGDMFSSARKNLKMFQSLDCADGQEKDDSYNPGSGTGYYLKRTNPPPRKTSAAPEKNFSFLEKYINKGKESEQTSGPAQATDTKDSKPLSFLHKYVGNSSEEKEAKKSPDSQRSINKDKRKSIGDSIKATALLAPMFKSKKDASSSPKLKSKFDKSMISAATAVAMPPDTSSTSSRATRQAYVNVELTQPYAVVNVAGGTEQEEEPLYDSAATVHIAKPTDSGVCSVTQYGGSVCSSSSSEEYKPGLSGGLDIVTDPMDYFSDDEGWDEDDFSDEDDTDTPAKSKRVMVYENPQETVQQYEAQVHKKKQIVEEIVSTEQTYVNKLYLLNKTAWELEGASLVTELIQSSAIHHMFPSVEALYRLHGENILPSLKVCLENWTDTTELSVLWKKYLPFLTMYRGYTSQYDGALDLINQQKKSSPDFAAVLGRLEEKPEYGKLTLEHHMLEPVQRIARYKLLLQNYHKLLYEDEVEHRKTTEVIESLDKLLQDCQKQLRRKDMFGDLCKLQERFEDTLSVLTPTAHLIKEGNVCQITGSSSKKKVQRVIFLFTDSILICSKRQTSKFKIVHQMELEEIKVRPVDPACAMAYGSERTMALKDRENSVILYFKNSTTKDVFEEAILDAITVKMTERQLRTDGSTTRIYLDQRENDAEFSRVPQWIADDNVTSCGLCQAKFVSKLRQKYHCRGCGAVVCGSCCKQKMALPCMNGEICRVCNICFLTARRRNPVLTKSISTLTRINSTRVPGVVNPTPRDRKWSRKSSGNEEPDSVA